MGAAIFVNTLKVVHAQQVQESKTTFFQYQEAKQKETGTKIGGWWLFPLILKYNKAKKKW